jgi:predicted permease
LNWKTKLDLARRSLGAFWDALVLQPRRLEDEMFQDLRFGLKLLLKHKGFTAVAVLSLALGIGANTAIFSLLDAVLLKSLPVQEPDRLVLFGKGESTGLTNDFPKGSTDLFSYPFYQEVRQRNEVFSEVGALLSIAWGVHGRVNGSDLEQMDVQLVSGTYFTTLDVGASLGRIITEADDQTPGGHPLAMVSYAWWERRLGGDPAAIGKTITIDQTAYTIVGVAPKEFFGTKVGEAPDLWVPLAMEAQLPPGHWNSRSDREAQSLILIGRLKNGVSPEQAGTAVNLLFKQALEERAGAAPSAERVRDIEQARVELTAAGKGLSELRREFSLSLQVLMAVVAVVLAVACANIANLLLARAAARQKEFAVRLALGAGRTRLIRQLLTESLLLAGLGGAAGIVLAWWGSRLLVLMVSSGSEPLPLDVAPNLRILGFTLLTSLLAAVIFGTTPAWRASRIEPNAALKSGKGGAQGLSQSPLGKVLVVGQVALSLVLLVGAGLFVRTLINLQNVPTGFNQQNVLLFRVDTTATGYKVDQMIPLLREVEERVTQLPGVQAASFVFMSFNQGQWTSTMTTREETMPEGPARLVRNNVVGKDYFTAMGIPLVAGRNFNARDSEKTQRVAVISETMAERFFPNRSPLGKHFGRTQNNPDQFEIVGVVKDAKYGSLVEAPRPMAYYFYEQQGDVLNNLVVRYSGAPETIVPQVRRTLQQVNSNLPIDDVLTMSDQIGRSLVQQKLVARLATFFGLLALLLACIGLYGVLAYAVARRTGEIGIRIALGAGRRDVLKLVLGEALALVFAGVALGLLVSVAVTQTAATLLFQLQPNDPLTLALATVLLVTVAALSGYLPARRAARIDPMVALKDE